MFSLTRTALVMRKLTYTALVASFASMGLVTGSVMSPVAAAPTHGTAGLYAFAQNVDWMSTETAASLDIGIDVLVPSWLPEPFSGYAPGVSASDGYYQLYWMIPGGPPTFLYVEGIAGGSLPAGSPADLNKPLTVNASVQGWNAIHDIGVPAGGSSPIYDQVWWVANGVLYTVSSQNMTGSDSLSLANSLVSLEVPASEPVEVPTDPPVAEQPDVSEPDVVEQPVVSEPDVSEQPVVSEPDVSEPDAVEQPDSSESDAAGQPVVSEPEVVEDVVVSEDPRVVDTSTLTEARQVVTSEAEEGNDTDPVPTEAPTEETRSNVSAPGEPWSPDRRDPSIPSDGTSGPVPPVLGGDGTGGLFDNALPLIKRGPLFIP